MGLRFRIAACLAWGGLLPIAAAPLPRPYTIESYAVRLQPDLAGQRLEGEATIRVHNVAETPISALDLDAGKAIKVTSVVEGKAAQWFERKDASLVVVLTTPLEPDGHRTITVRYEAGPASGLKFYPDQVYGSAVADWLPSSDRPTERATLDLTIAAASDLKAAASGKLAGSNQWRLDSPIAPSWFGFALGRFSEAESKAGKVTLRVLGASAKALGPTAAAMRYLADHTGKPYPDSTYTQVFCHGDVTHAMAAGVVLLPEASEGDRRLIAGELAQQWYGVSITPKDWPDLWLSDGLSAFLADAFLGDQAYEHAVEHSREIYNQLRMQGKDEPLADIESTSRAIAIDKGVWFLYLLKQLVGDSGFWEALRAYTGGQWGHAATTEDFQSAFLTTRMGAKGSPKAVNNLFDVWVYGIPGRKK